MISAALSSGPTQNCTGIIHPNVSSIKSVTRTSTKAGIGNATEFLVRGSKGNGWQPRSALQLLFNSTCMFMGRLRLISSMTSSNFAQLSTSMYRPQCFLRFDRPKIFSVMYTSISAGLYCSPLIPAGPGLVAQPIAYADLWCLAKDLCRKS